MLIAAARDPEGLEPCLVNGRLSVNLCGMKEYVREAFLASLKKH